MYCIWNPRMVLIRIVQIYLSIRSYRKYSKWIQICIPIPGMMFQFTSFTSIFSPKIFFHHYNRWPVWKSTPPIFYPDLLEKKIMLSTLKHQVFSFWPKFSLKYIGIQGKYISKFWRFQSIMFPVKWQHAKQNKKFRLAPQKILGFDPKLSDLLREIWFCHLLKLIVKCPQERSYVI